MSLVLYNTLARAKESFEPLQPDHVRMYVCGPTVYARAHIGNARPIIVFDVLYRVLKSRYPRVTYVRNITDVDDKINAAAKERGESIAALTEWTSKAFYEDMAPLGTLEPDVEPRATQHIEEMIDLVRVLIDRGHAYEAEAHVLFHIPSMPEYGRLSRRSLDEMIAGARVEVAPYKKHPADFVLWKPSPPDLPGWDSPWGRGRPGWHIECSAMSAKHLGVPFDIHGGGQDLVFPHHENEIAQSVCARDGAPFVRYWMHNGLVMVEGEKMSKSVGNILTVGEILDAGHRGETVRFLMLSTHYRKPLDWTEAGLREAKEALDYLYKPLWMAGEAGVELRKAKRTPAPIAAALEDDLNTPVAVARLHKLAGRLNRANKINDRPTQMRVSADLLAAGGLLGLLQEDPEKWFQHVIEVPAAQLIIEGFPPTRKTELVEKLIKIRIAEREAARKARDFATADHIRDDLAEQGVILEDRPDGTTRWRRTG